jgi:hypothetical protein
MIAFFKDKFYSKFVLHLYASLKKNYQFFAEQSCGIEAPLFAMAQNFAFDCVVKHQVASRCQANTNHLLVVVD